MLQKQGTRHPTYAELALYNLSQANLNFVVNPHGLKYNEDETTEVVEHWTSTKNIKVV